MVPPTASRMAFCLLGPLEIRCGGRLLRLDAPKRRALVAALLVNANRVVSTEELVEALWGQDAPRSARAQVQSLVSEVRSLLATDAESGARLLTRSPGYVLRVGDDELDALAFERAVDGARAAASTGIPEAAIDHYRHADGLWRGAALGRLLRGLRCASRRAAGGAAAGGA